VKTLPDGSRLTYDGLEIRYDAAIRRIAVLEALINTPHTTIFEAVRLEAAHQRERGPLNTMRVKPMLIGSG